VVQLGICFQSKIMKLFFFILVLIPMFSGCATIDRAIMTDPPPVTNPQTGEVTDPPPHIKPELQAAIQLAGDVIPVPWAGIAANGIALILTAYGSIRGRKWKKAATSAIQAGNEFRQVAKQVAPEKYQEVKNRIIGSQNADGTRSLIKTILLKVS